MSSDRRKSIRLWLLVSLALHAGAALALWRGEFARTSPDRGEERSPVSVELIARAAPSGPIPDAPKAAAPTPPVAAPPRPHPQPRPEIEAIEIPTTPEPAEDTQVEEILAAVETRPDVPPGADPDPSSVATHEGASQPDASADANDAPSSTVEASTPDPMLPYVALVRARIEAKQRYPSMARRRGDDGLVRARLVIASSGRLQDLGLSGRGSKLLQRATREAVEAAAPFPAPPVGDTTIEVSIRWRVTR